ncbi:MAG: beta-lactamase class [Candidatus Sumerlaeota bacterium]|nr:beta-lactamase class [Candidatus Sumerlaeota bacterium]
MRPALLVIALLLPLLGACASRARDVHTPPEPPPLSTSVSPQEFEARLLAEVARIESDLGCRIGLSFQDKATGLTVTHNGSSIFHPASTMKVPVMIETFRQSEQGLFDLDGTLVVTETFPSMIDGSPYTASPNPPLRAHLGEPTPIRFIVEEMIQISDNAATNMLILLCTPQKITATMRELGARDGFVIRPLEDEEAYKAGLSNRLSPNDLTTLMAAIDQNRAASPQSCEEMRAILRGQRHRDMIPAKLPPEAIVGNKTGSITGHRHDTAIVQAPFATYYLTVLVEGLEDSETGVNAVADLSRLIWDLRERMVE